MPRPLIYLVAALLFVAATPLPYGFYMLLRLVATAAFIWAAIVCAERKHTSLLWFLVILAVLFNPIVKFPLTKQAWAFIDVGAGLMLLITKKYFEQNDEA